MCKASYGTGDVVLDEGESEFSMLTGRTCVNVYQPVDRGLWITEYLESNGYRARVGVRNDNHSSLGDWFNDVSSHVCHAFL